jgi:CspA family cold shock protein
MTLKIRAQTTGISDRFALHDRAPKTRRLAKFASLAHFVRARSQRTVFGALRLPLPSHGFPARRAPIPGPPPERKNIMPIGKVKFFNVDKGYGFIQPEDGGNDAFVHISAVQAAGMNSLVQDQRVSYELQNDQRGKTSAVNLQNA